MSVEKAAPVVSIRADCNAEIGYGHIMRSLTVARSLGRNGAARARFIMTADSDATPVETQGLEVVRLSPGQTGVEDITDHADPGDGPLLLDSYDISTKDLERLQKDGFCIAMFDDGCRLENYPCDVVVDSAPDAASLPYRGLPETRFCLGSEYFPLRPEFANQSRAETARTPVRTIVVTFGGSDSYDATMRVLEVLADIGGDFKIVAILGPGYDGHAEQAGKHDRRVRVLRNVIDMAAVFGSADIAVSGGGNTASELAFLGVPTILLPLSKDQYPVAVAMEKVGAAVCLGHHDKNGNAAIAQALCALIGDHKRRQAMSRAGRSQIDGNGAERIAETILSLTLE